MRPTGAGPGTYRAACRLRWWACEHASGKFQDQMLQEISRDYEHTSAAGAITSAILLPEEVSAVQATLFLADDRNSDCA